MKGLSHVEAALFELKGLAPLFPLRCLAAYRFYAGLFLDKFCSDFIENETFRQHDQ